MKILKYKNYTGSIKFSEADRCWYGQILNIVGTSLYEGNTLKELEQDFRSACDATEKPWKTINWDSIKNTTAKNYITQQVSLACKNTNKQPLSLK